MTPPYSSYKRYGLCKKKEKEKEKEKEKKEKEKEKKKDLCQRACRENKRKEGVI
jgi:hypothetical protein